MRAAVSDQVTLDRILPALEAHPASLVIAATLAGTTAISFAGLRKRVDAASAALAALGAGHGRRIGILGENSLAWLVADLASLTLGAVSVPFDPAQAWSIQRLRKDWELEILLTDAGSGPGILCLAELASVDTAAEPSRPRHHYRADESYTIKFTSGTTAKPKAVAASAAHFNHMARHIDAMFPLGPDDTFVVFGSLATWLQRFMTQLCLLRGARLYIAKPEHATVVLERERPTVVLGVPRLLESLHAVSRRRPGGLAATWGGRMRYLWTGSAPIDRSILDAYERASIPVYEGYGMTETGMIAKNYPGHCRIGSVGPPFPDKHVKLSGEGEILVRNNYHAADRYLFGEPGLFRPDGWVATGDLGRFDADGFLYVIGRIKDLIVLQSGHKVQPSYVEEKLRNEISISDCIVLGDGRPHLVAVIVPREPDLPDSNLQAALDRINASAPAHYLVLGFVRSAPFASSGLTTPAGKLCRPAIADRFAAQLDALYQDK